MPAMEKPKFPIRMIRLASIPHPDWKKYEGMMLQDAVAAHCGQDGRREIDKTHRCAAHAPLWDVWPG